MLYPDEPMPFAGQFAPRQAGTDRAERTRIWMLEDLQCSILGTCLSILELRQLAKKAGFELAKDTTEYQLHGFFVGKCRTQNPLSRLVQKHLDKKYQRAVRRFNQAREPQALVALWRESLALGDVAGPYWAACTHPLLDETSFSEVFGDVHMLSHLAGASNRADIRKLRQLEERLEDMEVRHGQVKAAYRRRLQALSQESRRLKAVLVEERRDREECRESPGVAGLEFALERMSAALKEALAARELAEKRLEAVTRRLERAESELVERAAERDHLEAECIRLLGRGQNGQDSSREGVVCRAADCERCSLAGQCILYVGGRTSLVQHYRELVESWGGEFLHHDGGQEQALSRLHQMLPRAKAVVCPVDCVSHEAFKYVKGVCGQTFTPCIPMRGSGLSSLAKTLSCLAQSVQPDQPAAP